MHDPPPNIYNEMNMKKRTTQLQRDYKKRTSPNQKDYTFQFLKLAVWYSMNFVID